MSLVAPYTAVAGIESEVKMAVEEVVSRPILNVYDCSR